MKILHYTLGFPPHRSGGLVKYAVDLMEEQYRQGHEVHALYPGRINPLIKKTFIRPIKFMTFKKYEIINSLPLAIFGGIRNPEDFMKEVPVQLYIQFLKSINPDVIHIHTLMGIHKEFFKAAKELDILLVYTSHDYFGLAPEPTFFYNGISYDHQNTIENWIRASEDAMSTSKLRIFQARLYPLMRRGAKYITKTSKSLEEPDKKIKNKDDILIDGQTKKRYSKLKRYYKEIFTLINKFHFNSNLAKEIFIRNIELDIFGKVISITNSNIHSKLSVTKKTPNKKIRLVFIGPDKEYKGFFEFLTLSKKLSSQKYEFHTYGYEPREYLNNITQHGKYKSTELTRIYQNVDILIVPSVWKETFGLIVIEALSYRTPVLVSNNVGAKDLVPNAYIFSSNEELTDMFEHRLPHIEDYDFEMKNMVLHQKELKSFYNEVEY